ncbi:unnamed protein product [Owenia fusiformis]|uniref:Phosphotransferase n=1 Tax=Owenia fusiformis TaxID=6347 RepID=A0A8S4P3L4_OWEFU|nr:unnamed protein product [Owenia fusiformis]
MSDSTGTNFQSLPQLPTGENMEKVKSMVDSMLLDDAAVQKMMSVLESEMKKGMSKDESIRKTSSCQMENTYVTQLLDGTEEGDYLALDLGGTNFRVLLVKFRQGKAESISRNYNLTKEQLHGPCEGVFDHLARSIGKFLQEENITNRLPLGFTFSFPMTQNALNCGVLVTWTKSFKCPDGVGQDAVKMLEDAIAKIGGINVDIVAVLNDTTGTLAAGSYLDHQCEIGMILGTGSNAAYMEYLTHMEKWEGPIDSPKQQVAIDIEWGAFGDNGSLDWLKTDYDIEVDLHSNHVHSFTFEKLFSGMYIGEIVRLCLLHLQKDGLIFKGGVSDKFSNRWIFTASHVSVIEEDNLKGTSEKLDGVLKELDMQNMVSESDKDVIKYTCAVVSLRAAQIIGAATAVLLNHISKPEVTVAIDGSLYKYHPKLHDLLMGVISKLSPSTKCKLILAEDGSGRGAGFVAAVATRLQKQH